MDSDGPENKNDWHSLLTKEVLDHLQTSYSGLSEFEAQNRLKQEGPNVLKSKERKSYFYRYINCLHGYLAILLLLSILLGIIVEN